MGEKTPPRRVRQKAPTNKGVGEIRIGGNAFSYSEGNTYGRKEWTSLKNIGDGG